MMTTPSRGAPTLGNVVADVPEKVADRYKIRLGGGGMGSVYAALDIELHAQVALKILKPGDALERFRNLRSKVSDRAGEVLASFRSTAGQLT